MSARDEALVTAIIAGWDDAFMQGNTASMLSSEGRARVTLAALRAAGYAVVPVEPTQEMLMAATFRPQPDPDAGLYAGIYRAMISSAEASDA